MIDRVIRHRASQCCVSQCRASHCCASQCRASCSDTDHYRFRPLRLVAALTALGLVLSACAVPDFTPRNDALSIPRDSATGIPLPAGARVEKAGTRQGTEVEEYALRGSLKPDGRTAAERIPSIVERGYLIVGIQQSQNLLSFRDPTTGQLSGFEVDLAHEIAEDIFGDRNAVDFRFVESQHRVHTLSTGKVDFLLSTLTITPERQQEVEFSTPYLSTNTRLLVNRNSEINRLEDLAARTVCVTDNSTGINLARLHSPQADILKAVTWADCLYAMQHNQADAILVDDVILSGLEIQDPYTEIVGPAVDSDIYGVGMPKPARSAHADEIAEAEGLVRQVNSTLERIRTDGTWWELFRHWFAGRLPTAGPPPLHYRPEDGE